MQDRYLGDGVYASFDGYQIWLKAHREGREHSVAIEGEVFVALQRYVEDLKREARS